MIASPPYARLALAAEAAWRRRAPTMQPRPLTGNALIPAALYQSKRSRTRGRSGILLAMHDDAQSLGTLAARAHDLLKTVGHPLAPDTLVEHVFGMAGSGSKKPGAADFWRGQLGRLLADTRLFAQQRDGSWGLTEWGTAEVPLDHMEYIVVDCETTGLNPHTNRIIEIAALRCRGPLVVERFETLIDPQHAIPRMIWQLTGISTEMVKDAPLAAAAMAEFLRFAGGCLLVGHNVRFDLGFLGAEAHRHHGTRLGNPSICTIRLAARLLPHLRRPNLDNLARALDLRTEERHRAMGDARVTQLAFWRLVERARERGVTTQGGLLALAGPTAGSTHAVGGHGTGRLLLDPALRRGLPERPGVYLMKDERGTIIYVGKAKNLKQRIASYYSQPLGYKRKMDGLLESVRALETIVVGSELEALILESRRIKEHLPQFNVQQRHYRHYPFIKVDVTSPFPRVFATREVLADAARYFGPFRSKQAVDTVVDLVHRLFPIRSCTRLIAADGRHRGRTSACLRFHVGRCLGPCMGAVTPEAYGAVISEVLDFLAGGQESMLARVELEMRRSAERLDFERSARLRDALRHARQVMLSQQLLTGAVEQNNLVIVCPGVEAGGAELFGIRHGRLFEQLTMTNTFDPDTPTMVADFLNRLYAAASAPPVVGQEEVDAIIIIGRWLARYGDSPRVVHLDEGYGAETVERFVQLLRSDLTSPERTDDFWLGEENDE